MELWGVRLFNSWLHFENNRLPKLFGSYPAYPKDLGVPGARIYLNSVRLTKKEGNEENGFEAIVRIAGKSRVYPLG